MQVEDEGHYVVRQLRRNPIELASVSMVFGRSGNDEEAAYILYA
jgi:hypothetical protein